jgi:DNA-binding MarR family transcriptional regulator
MPDPAELSSPFTVSEETDLPPPPLIGALLRGPWQAVRDRMLAGLHARGFGDLTAAHLNVLQYPGPDAMRPSELAARTRMTRQALNYLLGQMEELGYLERRGEPSGGARRVYLTDRGHSAMETIREVVAALEAEWEAQLGSGEFARLRELLVALQAVAADSG